MIKAVIFDMDGTIINTALVHDFPTWQEVFAQQGYAMNLEDFKKASGGRAHDIIKKRLPNISDTDIEVFIEKRTRLLSESINIKGLILTPGFLPLQKQLRTHHIKLALATGAIVSKVAVIQRHIPLDKYFDVIVTGSDITVGKPHPKIFLQAAAKLAISPQHCLVIEDAANGITAAKSAGMQCIALTTTHEREELQQADAIIDSFDELSVDKIETM